MSFNLWKYQIRADTAIPGGINIDRSAVETAKWSIADMFSDADMLRLQQEQYQHDHRNHTDILHLSKNDRLKHYGLHFAKYAGRLARGSSEAIPYDRTIVDTVLVSLSAANTLNQRLASPSPLDKDQRQIDPLRTYADAAGRFADACEKIDHMEEFIPIARKANSDVMSWALQMAHDRELDLENALGRRRGELRERPFYIAN